MALRFPILLLLALWANVTFAAGSSSKYMIQETIERRAGVLVQRFDKQALVFATVTFQSESSGLPGTPFVLKSLTLDQEAEPKVQSIRLAIFTKLKPLPEDLQTLLKSAITKFGATPSFDVQPLPKAIEGDEEAAKDDAKTATEAPVEDKAKTEEVKPLAPGDDGYTKELILKNPLLSVIALLIMVLSAVATVFTFTFIKTATRNFKTLDQGLKSVASSVESAGGGKDLRTVQSEAAPQRVVSDAAAVGDTFKSLGLDSLRALLMDCYWGESDRYAAYVWKRLPTEKRIALVGRDQVLASYVATLQGIGEEDKGVEQEAYYLSPLAISHVDNDALSELARRHRGLLKVLPSLRADALNLTVPERVAMISEQETGSLPDFASVPASPLRTLIKRSRFKIHSLEEELQVLALPELKAEMARDIPTLAWLSEVPPERIKGVLAGFSAQQLAEAWIGPDFVLEKLAQCLPEKKLKLVLTYKDRTPPNRESEAFQALCRRGAELRFGDLATAGEDQGNAA